MKLIKTAAFLFAFGLLLAVFGCDDTITPGLELGATYYLGYYGSAADPAAGTETVPVAVSGFRLDKTEVTVGEFREFVTEYFTGWRPNEGDGAHPNIEGSGWQSVWTVLLPPTGPDLVAQLKSLGASYTWTDVSGGNEQKPINSVTWYEAFAYCIWKGGRLPTEAEWECAAAGGDKQNLYPWGSAAPSGAYSAFIDSVSGAIQPTGSRPAGAARWGHLDMAGNVWEWVLDCYISDYPNPAFASSSDPANLNPAINRTMRGGSASSPAKELAAGHSAGRAGSDPASRRTDCGFRCAYN